MTVCTHVGLAGGGQLRQVKSAVKKKLVLVEV